MLRIYYGRACIDKEKFIFDHVNAHERTLLLVPDQFTLEAERQAFAHLHTEALLHVEVLSFSRLGNRILSELGGGKQTFIDKYGRHMVLTAVARQLREQLQVFRGLEERNSFIEMVNNFISELKQYNCGPAELAAMAQEDEVDSYTRRKLADLTLLYRRYEEEIRGKYTDSEDLIGLYLQKIGQSKLIAGSRIWVYGFDSFAPKALNMIGQLAAQAVEVNVVLTYDRQCRDAALFTLTGMVMENLQQEARAVGVESQIRSIPAETRTARPAAIAHIERELYTLPARKQADCAGIHLVAASNFYSEAESAAAYVLHLVRDRGFRYRDIRLVCNDQEVRGPIIERVFAEYGIPVCSDNKRDILSNPIVQYITSLLDVVIRQYRSEDVFRVLKSGFGPLTREEIAVLENYTMKYRIRRTMWLRPFAKGRNEYGPEGLAALEGLRQRAIAPFTALAPLLEAKTVGEFIQQFYRFLYEEVKLPEQITAFIEAQEAMGHGDLAQETTQIWAQVVRILDQMMEIMGDEAFVGSSFAEILNVGLSQVEIGVLPQAVDGLLMGTMQRVRLSTVRVLMVIGANEGVLPQEKPPTGLFSSEEKALFQEKGQALCKVDSIMLMEERLAIYRNLSKPTDCLWMSYALADEEGKESRPSSVYLRLQEIFPTLTEEADVLSRDDAMSMIGGDVATLRHLSEHLQMLAEGETLSPAWRATLRWYRQNAPTQLLLIEKGLLFTNQQEKLGAAAARALFLRDPAGAISLSPSRLERFSRCPFSHFVAYGLHPEERRIFAVAPREIGDLYHTCLMALSRALTRPDLEITHPLSPWMTVTRQQCAAMVQEIVERQIADYREGVFQLGGQELYRSHRIIAICEEACWAAIEQVRAGRITRSAFEVGFRRNGEIPPVTVEVNGETIYIEGKIDRVDYLPNERVKIIDYKTGNETFSVSEAEAGYRLQLMLYLEAACEGKREPAGVFYFPISEPMIDVTEKDDSPDIMEKEIRKQFKLNGVLVDEPEVIESVAGTFSGYSEVVPLRKSKEGVKGTGAENLLTAEAFAAMREAVNDKVKEICRNLTAGAIDIYPMKSRERSACTFCEFRGICRFDTVFAGCAYHVIS